MGSLTSGKDRFRLMRPASAYQPNDRRRGIEKLQSSLICCANIFIQAICALAAGLTSASGSAMAASEMQELAATLHSAEFSPRVDQLLKAGHPAQALELADLGLEKNPRSAQLRFSRTVALERLGRTEEAAKALRSLIAEYPEIPEPYNNLAVIEAGMGSLEEAVKLLDRALLLNPNFATALKNRGDVYLALALESYEAAAPSLTSNTELQQRLKTLRRLTAH